MGILLHADGYKKRIYLFSKDDFMKEADFTVLIHSMTGYLTKGKRAPRISQIEIARTWCRQGMDPSVLEKRLISEYIGFGVFAKQRYEKGDFLLEYCGERISLKEADEVDHNYLFGFKYAGKFIWIDGFDTDRLGRFVNDAENHSNNCNTKPKMVMMQGYPHICLFATKLINSGDEIRYDYGDDSGDLFWRNQKNDVSETKWNAKRKVNSPKKSNQLADGNKSADKPEGKAKNSISNVNTPGNNLALLSGLEPEIRDWTGMHIDISEVSALGNEPTVVSVGDNEIKYLSGEEEKKEYYGMEETGISYEDTESDGSVDMPLSSLPVSSHGSYVASQDTSSSKEKAVAPMIAQRNAKRKVNSPKKSNQLADGNKSADKPEGKAKNSISNVNTPGNNLALLSGLEPEIRDWTGMHIDISEVSALGNEPTVVSVGDNEIKYLSGEEEKKEYCGMEETGISYEDTESDGSVDMPLSSLPVTSHGSYVASQDTSSSKGKAVAPMIAQSHFRRVFVCSGSERLKKQISKLVAKCGGEYVPKFQSTTTHVIMQCRADKPRCCERSLKYFLGIAHHCWVLDHEYVQKCSEAGYFLPEEEFEILGDQMFPCGLGASMSRQNKRLIMRGMMISFTEESADFPKDAAEDIVHSLGGEVKKNSSCIVSLEETGGPNTVDREWLFDCLSKFTVLDMGLYYSGKYSEDSNEESDMYDEDNEEDKDYVPDSGDSESDKDMDFYVPDSGESDSNMSSDMQIRKANQENIQIAKIVPDSGESDSNMSSDMQIRKANQENIEIAKSSDSESIIFPSQVHDKSDNDNCESRKYPTQVLDTCNLNNSDSTLSIRDEQCVENETGVNVQHATIKIAVSKKTKDGRRVWDKRHACVFCKKQYAKLARHLEQVHASEIDVQRALAFNKNSKERKEAWREIMNRGDFAHNVKVLEKQQGEIIPFKRPSKEADGLKYVQCVTCLGTFRSSVLWRHVKNSHPENKDKRTKLKKHHQVSSAALLPVSGVVADNFREIILNRMANDAVSLAARNDSDIVRYGQKMFQKSARNPHQNQYVRQKLRELARFLVSIRAIDSTVIRLRDCIDSRKFSLCVKAVKELCGYNEDALTFKIPSLANKIGHSLHKVARQLRTEAAKTGDDELKKKSKCFIEVYIEDWETEISHAALQTLAIEKYNKPTRIPLAQDLKALTTYLKKEAAILIEIFESNEATETEWRELCEVTLAETVLFNKRRSGEAERLEVKQYLNGIQHGKNNQEEVLQSLSPLEKKLSEVVDRIEIRGKRGRRVAILVHDNLRKQFDILVKNRSLGYIDESNKYMFARPGDSEFPVRAADVLRKYANECGAKHPKLLNSTSFRKHIAVIVQMLNLKDNELDVLADFLGHDIRVHREFYRLPQDTMQVAKISKLLIEMEKGNIQLYKGKSLDEIQFDLEEPLESEQESDDDDDESYRNESTPTTPNEGTLTTCKTTSKKATTCKTTSKKATTCKTTSKKVQTGGKRKLWTQEEEASVKRHLEKYFFLDVLPGKCEIEEARKKEPILSNRSWIHIKSFIKNKKISMKRKLGKAFCETN